MRTRQDGMWGAWTPVGLSDSAPDTDTSEARAAKVATEPVAVTGSDAVQVRVRSLRTATAMDRLSATFVDGGTSAADGSIGRMPVATAGAAVARPTIITRTQWGADESLRTCDPTYSGNIKGSVVHHTVNSNTYTASDVPAMLRSIYAYHVNGNGWCDVGYNFFVDRFGRLFEGRYGGMTATSSVPRPRASTRRPSGSRRWATTTRDTGAVGPAARGAQRRGEAHRVEGVAQRLDPETSAMYTSAGSSRWPAGTVITKPRVSGHRDFNLTDCPGDLHVRRALHHPVHRDRGLLGRRDDDGGSTDHTASPVVRPTPGRRGSSFTLAGRGFGHGLGMSQYGAYGAALKGLTRDQILAFYYPGTTRAATFGNPAIRVRLTALGSGGPRSSTRAALDRQRRVGTAALSGTNRDGTPRLRWRVVPTASG